MTEQKQNSSTPSVEPATSSKISNRSLRSIRFEMSVIFSMILAIILLVFSGVIYWIISTTVHTEMDFELKYQAKEVSDNIQLYLNAKSDDPAHFQYAIETTIAKGHQTQERWWSTGFDRRWQKKIDQQNLSNLYVNFASPDGKSLKFSKNVSPGLLELLSKKTRVPSLEKDDLYNVNLNGGTFRMINYPFNAPDGSTYVIQVGIEQEPAFQLLQNWMNRVLLSIPIILILTSFMGGLLAKRILRPVGEIAVLAKGITQEDLSKRVETRAFYQEMNPLIESFNGMISRLDKSFYHVRNFSSHIAHELKTPLTIIRGETELALMSPRTAEEYQATLKTNLEEVHTMLKIIEDLLFFTRMEHHPGCYKFEKTDFIAYMKDVCEQSKMLAANKSVLVNCKLPHVPFGTKVVVNADPVHLRRLFFNLIDNAIKFSPPRSQVDITVMVEAPQVIVRVKDCGRGITKEDAEKIFELFYSADTNSGGNGLGLSIAQAIAKSHGGIITVSEKSVRGAEFIVTLPLV